MELEVRVVSGLESCFASLPLFLIQRLIQSSSGGGSLPPVLALELRSRSSDALWNLAWSGSASQSAAIEVAQQLAECIGLQDQTPVLVKVFPTLSKAVHVSVEPCSENDWEILELNSDLAEDAILKQVGVVYEGMKFPLWFHGHVVVKFVVISVYPRKLVVQLVPGTEVRVAPKLRQKINSSEDMPLSDKQKLQRKALLRVQTPFKEVIDRVNFQGLELGVVFSSAIFIHPETARNLSLVNNQLVIILPKLHHSEYIVREKDGSTTRSNSIIESYSGDPLRRKEDSGDPLRRKEDSGDPLRRKEDSGDPLRRKEDSGHAFVYLLFSDSVAKGHVMLPWSLQLFLRVRLHSWIYLKSFVTVPKKEIPKLSFSPCVVKMFQKSKSKSLENSKTKVFSFENFKNHGPRKPEGDFCYTSDRQGRLLQVQDELLSFLPCMFPEHGRMEADLGRQIEYLVHAWITGQQKGMSSHADVDTSSMVLARKTMLHFEVIGGKNGDLVNPVSSLNNGDFSGELPSKLLFLLSASFEGESYQSSLYESFELPVKIEDRENINVDLNLESGEVEAWDPILLDSVFDRKLNRSYTSSVFSLRWLETASSDAISRILCLLSPRSGKLLRMHHLPFPGHVLIYGPPGSGKTSLTMVIAEYCEAHKEILAHIVFVNCSKLASEKSQSIRQTLSAYISEALIHSPSLVIFDDLDHIFPSSDFEDSRSSNSIIQLSQFLTDAIDEFQEKWQSSCGLGPIAFLASVQTLASLPKALTSSGRFDFHIQLPAPAVSEREDILNHEIYKRSLHCSAKILNDVASKCDGYDAYDLECLVDRAIHSAIGRHLCSHIAVEKDEKPSLSREDFISALEDFAPVAMRDLTKAASKVASTGWDDVGGLVEIRRSIQEMIEMPSKHPSLFSEAPLRLRSNVLLYGPPGCGKTHIVGAAASACSLRFISIKGPELLNKYIGASEQAVRDLFTKAAAAAPCLLFFDEFDSIAPKRGHDNTGVTDRVVNQLLTELDGVEALTGIFVFAATSRPDLLDAALLRPGRLDRLLFCDFPSWHERLDILKVLSRKLPLSVDVSLETISSMTEGFSGADLQALLSDAQLASIHELLEGEEALSVAGKAPEISGTHLISVASKARPSVSDAEKQRLYRIYNQFLDAKKSVNTQSRDAKGKRATLA